MIELKEYQKKAVNELMEKTVELLNTGKARNKLFFKAPTGAGKTVMPSVLLDRLTYELPTRGDCLHLNAAFTWIAPNKLHEQGYLNSEKCFRELLNSVVSQANEPKIELERIFTGRVLSQE